MSATETGIAEDNASDIADAGMAEEVVGVAELAAVEEAKARACTAEKIGRRSPIPVRSYTHMSISVCAHAQKHIMVDNVLIAINYY